MNTRPLISVIEQIVIPSFLSTSSLWSDNILSIYCHRVQVLDFTCKKFIFKKSLHYLFCGYSLIKKSFLTVSLKFLLVLLIQTRWTPFPGSNNLCFLGYLFILIVIRVLNFKFCFRHSWVKNSIKFVISAKILFN